MPPVTTTPVTNRTNRPATSTDGETYRVKRGDTLREIAQDHGVTTQDMIAANPRLRDPDNIRVGQELNIPARREAPRTPAAETPAVPAQPASRQASGAARQRASAPTAQQTSIQQRGGILQRGARGPEVERVQSSLVQLGYMSQATMDTGRGTFGPATKSAVQAFQRDNDLKDDGVVGSATRGALDRALAGRTDGPAAPSTPTTTAPAAGGRLTKPEVINSPSPNHDSRGGTDVDAIVLHHTATNNGAGDLAHMRRRGSGVSAHYMIDRDGTIHQLVPDNRRAWHAGRGALPGQRASDINSRSIGIEIVNDGSGRTPFTEAQYRSLERLVPYLAQTHDVPQANILGHRDVALPRGRKSDPADNFDWSRVRDAVSDNLA